MISKNSKKILVVEDSMFFRARISDMLVDAGHRVVFAKDGSEAIARLEKRPEDIDLLTLDLEMPNTDGFGVLEWLNENDFLDSFPVLVITSNPKTDELTERLGSLGASGLLSKSFSHEQIVNCINRILFTRETDSRVEPRVLVSVSGDYTVDEKKHIAFLLNLSTTGLCLRTRKELKRGSTIELKFSIPGSSTILEIKGFVKWSAPSVGAKNKSGIRFTSLSREDAEALRLFVEKEDRIFTLDL